MEWFTEGHVPNLVILSEGYHTALVSSNVNVFKAHANFITSVLRTKEAALEDVLFCALFFL